MEAIAAVGIDGSLGDPTSPTGLPWNIPEDLAHFKRLTKGKLCLFGTKTALTLPSEGLPGRQVAIVGARPDKSLADIRYPYIRLRGVDAAYGINDDYPAVACGGRYLWGILQDNIDKWTITRVYSIIDAPVKFDMTLLGDFHLKDVVAMPTKAHNCLVETWIRNQE